MPTRSTGRGPLSTARAGPRQKEPRDGLEPDGLGQAGYAAPPRRGRQRHAVRPDPHRSQQPRQPHAGRHARRGAGRAHGSARSLAAQTRQPARRQGLRPSPLSARVQSPKRHAPDRPAQRREQRMARPLLLDHPAHAGVAGLFPPPHHPLRARCRPPSRLTTLACAHICQAQVKRFCP